MLFAILLAVVGLAVLAVLIAGGGNDLNYQSRQISESRRTSRPNMSNRV